MTRWEGVHNCARCGMPRHRDRPCRSCVLFDRHGSTWVPPILTDEEVAQLDRWRAAIDRMAMAQAVARYRGVPA